MSCTRHVAILLQLLLVLLALQPAAAAAAAAGVLTMSEEGELGPRFDVGTAWPGESLAGYDRRTSYHVSSWLLTHACMHIPAADV